MAPLKLMTPRKVALLIVPSETSEAWSVVAVDAARARGWTSDVFLDRILQEGRPILLASEAWPEIQAFEPDYLVVIVPGPGDALAAAHWVDDERQKMRHVSHRMAEASMAAAVADQTVSSTVAEIDVPGLGMIRRLEVVRPVRRQDSASPLSIYDQVPPPPMASAIWPFDLFRFSDPGVEYGKEGYEIDITGRARALMFGPYIELPAGRWRVTFDFMISSPKVVPLRFEWGSLNGETVVNEKVRSAGRYRVMLDREWPAVEPAELRIYINHAVFDGRLTPLRCEVTRVEAAEPIVAAA